MSQHDVFLSYNRIDTEEMQTLKEFLVKNRFSVWTDEGIELGYSWQTAVEEAIKSAGCIVCILSPEAASSKWVREELKLAAIHTKPIYFAHIRGEDPDVAIFGFSDIQRINLKNHENRETELEKLLKALQALVPDHKNNESSTEASRVYLDKRKKMDEFVSILNEKIQKIIYEFSNGEISTQQFNLIYERYSNQLKIALQGRDGESQPILGGISTIAIKEDASGKPKGLIIYHQASQQIIVRIGTDEITDKLASQLHSYKSHSPESPLEFAELYNLNHPKFSNWVVLVTGRFVTLAVFFVNEPAQAQIRGFFKSLEDYEKVNETFLQQEEVDVTKIGSTFQGLNRVIEAK